MPMSNIISKDNLGPQITEHYRYIRLVAMVYITFLLAATVVAYRIVIIGLVPEPGSTLIYTFSFFLANGFNVY